VKLDNKYTCFKSFNNEFVLKSRFTTIQNNAELYFTQYQVVYVYMCIASEATVIYVVWKFIEYGVCVFQVKHM